MVSEFQFINQSLNYIELNTTSETETTGSNVYLITFVVVLQLLAIITHGCGLYLLIYLFSTDRGDVELVYITSLSIIEVCATICLLVEAVLLVTIRNAINYINYINVFLYTTVSFVLYMTMIFITVDRALEVVLNIRYPLFWNITKAKYLVFVIWFLGFMAGIISVVVYAVNGFEHKLLYTYFRPIFDIILILIAVISHSYIFTKYIQTHRRPSASYPTVSPFKIFRHSRLYISVLLLVTFLIFTVIPDIVSVFVRRRNRELTVVAVILYQFSILCDVYIYIFLHLKVKRLLYRKMSSIICCRNIVRSQVHAIVNIARINVQAEILPDDNQ